LAGKEEVCFLLEVKFSQFLFLVKHYWFMGVSQNKEIIIVIKLNTHRSSDQDLYLWIYLFHDIVPIFISDPDHKILDWFQEILCIIFMTFDDFLAKTFMYATIFLHESIYNIFPS